MITWRDTYSIGIDEIDEQHKQLFAICVNVFNILKEATFINKQEDISIVLKELEDYTIYHFSQEETLMKSVDYPFFATHKAEHDKFILKLNELKFHEANYNQNAHLQDILRWIINWISNHILERDKKVGEFITSAK
jgi:hemerythrin